MLVRHQILYFLMSALLIGMGCAKRIAVSFDQAQPQTLLKIKTVSSKTYCGIIQEKHPDYILLKRGRYENNLTKISRDEILGMSRSDLVYDGAGTIISEWEIQEKQGNKNFIFYTIGGAGLSFGASFFVGSLIHRSQDDPEKGNKILWSVAGLGTTVGTYFFARAGKARDRNLAIENIREERYKFARQKFENQKSKHHTVQQELEQEKAERIKQEAEIKKLQEEIQKKKKEK